MQFYHVSNKTPLIILPIDMHRILRGWCYQRSRKTSNNYCSWSLVCRVGRRIGKSRLCLQQCNRRITMMFTEHVIISSTTTTTIERAEEAIGIDVCHETSAHVMHRHRVEKAKNYRGITSHIKFIPLEPEGTELQVHKLKNDAGRSVYSRKEEFLMNSVLRYTFGEMPTMSPLISPFHIVVQ